MTEPLTPMEQRVYQYLLDFLAENTYQPSIRDIGKRFKIKSTKTVSDLLASLAAKGFIERDPSRSRGVRIVGYSAVGGTQPIPYYGKIHAGEPALLPEHRLGFITMDRRFVPSAEAYFLKIKGTSMIGRGIDDGDFVMVNPGGEAHDGDVIAARLGEEATVKTLTHRAEKTVLVPANPAEREIEVGAEDDFAVLGVVSGIFRPFFDPGPFQEGGVNPPAAEATLAAT
jgi:repressor LexA